MKTQLLLGKKVAESLELDYQNKIMKLRKNGVIPGLAVVLIGNNPASKVYVNSKEKYFKKMNCFSKTFFLQTDVSEDEVIKLIIALNNDNRFHGILLQLPIPNHINESKILSLINPNKDVDGFHPINFGKLFQGDPQFVPCTPNGIVKMIDYFKISTSGKKVVIIGRSNIVGKPMFALLSQKFKNGNATVTLCHTGTINIRQYTMDADIIIAAAGQPEMIDSSMVKQGVVIFDVGINRVNTNNSKGYKLVGDVDFDSVNGIAGSLTPVPGGVGPMTITMLLLNTVDSAFNLK